MHEPNRSHANVRTAEAAVKARVVEATAMKAASMKTAPAVKTACLPGNSSHLQRSKRTSTVKASSAVRHFESGSNLQG